MNTKELTHEITVMVIPGREEIKHKCYLDTTLGDIIALYATDRTVDVDVNGEKILHYRWRDYVLHNHNVTEVWLAAMASGCGPLPFFQDYRGTWWNWIPTRKDIFHHMVQDARRARNKIVIKELREELVPF